MPPEREKIPEKNVLAAARIFEEYGRFIRSIIKNKVGDDDKTDELVHDYFLSLAANPIPPNVRDIRSYIYRAIHRDVGDSLTRIENYRARLHKYAEYRKISVNNHPSRNAFIEEDEMRRVVELIRKRLPPGQAEAVVMRYRDGCQIGEIANKLALNPRSVSRYICVGLSMMRKLFEKKKEENVK